VRIAFLFQSPNLKLQRRRDHCSLPSIYPSIIHRFAFPISVCDFKMADVVMTDIPAPAKRAAGKAKAGGAEGGADGKKRFEVKKVRAFYASYGEAAKALTI
jgi:hypothetical protein